MKTTLVVALGLLAACGGTTNNVYVTVADVGAEAPGPVGDPGPDARAADSNIPGPPDAKAPADAGAPGDVPADAPTETVSPGDASADAAGSCAPGVAPLTCAGLGDPSLRPCGAFRACPAAAGGWVGGDCGACAHGPCDDTLAAYGFDSCRCRVMLGLTPSTGACSGGNYDCGDEGVTAPQMPRGCEMWEAYTGDAATGPGGAYRYWCCP